MGGAVGFDSLPKFWQLNTAALSFFFVNHVDPENIFILVFFIIARLL